MLKDNYTIEETKRTMKPRNPFITLVILIITTLIPSMIFGLGFMIIYVQNADPSTLNKESIMAAMTGDKFTLGNLALTFFVALALFYYARKFQRRNNASLGLTHPQKFTNYMRGMVIGLLMMLVTFLILLISGQIEVVNNLSNVSPLIFIIFIIGWMVQGFEEELMCRSILMNYFAARRGVVAGIVINSLIFSLLHLANPGFGLLPFITIFLMGVIFSLMFYISDDIFLPAAAHSFWNFAQGNIFGITVSGGFAMKNTIIRTNLVGNPILTGGSFGVEGGLIVMIVELIVVGVLVKLALDKNKNTKEKLVFESKKGDL